MWNILVRYIPILRFLRTDYRINSNVGVEILDRILLRNHANTGQEASQRNNMSFKKGLKKYEKRQLQNNKIRESNFFSIKNIIILLILIITFIYIYHENYSTQSIYTAIFIFVGVTLYLLIVERFREKIIMEQKIEELQNLREKEHQYFLEKVKELQKEEKNCIEQIVLKNEEGYDIKTWKIGRKNSIILGKNTLTTKVDIDISGCVYSNLVSRMHGILTKTNGIWYYEDLNSRNGSGLERKIEGKKVKLKSNTPIKVEKGDIIYLATTRVLIN